MKRDKTADPIERKNVSLRRSVIAIGENLAEVLHKNSFSQLLSDLVLAANKRQALGDKSAEQSLAEMVELLAENRKLKEKIQSRRQLDRASMDMAAEYRRLFEEANSRLPTEQKVEDTLKSGKWANNVPG
jgi:hypothetical protein